MKRQSDITITGKLVKIENDRSGSRRRFVRRAIGCVTRRVLLSASTSGLRRCAKRSAPQQMPRSWLQRHENDYSRLKRGASGGDRVGHRVMPLEVSDKPRSVRKGQGTRQPRRAVGLCQRHTSRRLSSRLGPPWQSGRSYEKRGDGL